MLFLLVRNINGQIEFSRYEFYGDTYQRPLEKLLKTIPEHGIVLRNHLLRPSEELKTKDRLGEIISYGLSALGKDTLSADERTKIAVYAAQLKEADMDCVVTSLQTALIEDQNFLGVNADYQKNIPPAMQSYKTKTGAFVDMLQQVAEQPRIPVSLDNFVESGMAARDESFALWETAVDGQDSLLKTRIETFQGRMVIYLLLTLLSLAVSVLLAYAITRSITRPLRLVVSNLCAQASMGFTRKIVLSRSDELGQMAQGINQVVDSLRATMQKIVGSSSSLSSSSHSLAMASVELSQSVEHSPFLKEMVGNTKDVAKEVAQNAADLQKLAHQFKFR